MHGQFQVRLYLFSGLATDACLDFGKDFKMLVFVLTRVLNSQWDF